jgi:hypothetical protein
MLTAYFDESGIHDGDHLCVVAGFVGNDAQWTAFVADWVPSIAPRMNLHMNSLRWNQHPDRIGRLLAKVGPIPERYNLRPVSIGMRQRDYNELMKGKLREDYTNPYMLCAQTCIAAVLSEIAGPEEVLFIFERQHVYKKAMAAMHNIVFELIGVDSRVKDINFISNKTTVCLDPADYLAFMVRERELDINSEKSKMGASIVGTRDGLGGIFSRESVEQMTAVFLSNGMGINDSPHYAPEFFTEVVKNPYWRGPKMP